MAENSNEPGTSKVEHTEEVGEDEVEEEEEEFLPGYQTMQEYSEALLKEVVKATKAANSLPGEGDDFDYYCSFPGFRTFCSKMESRVTRSISRLIRHQSLPCYWPPPPAQAPPTSGQGEEAGLVAMVEERMEAIIEANDVLLERVGVLMDEACGLRKKREEEEAVLLTAPLHQGTAEVASWNDIKSSGKKSKYSFMASRNVPRPQQTQRQTTPPQRLPETAEPTVTECSHSQHQGVGPRQGKVHTSVSI
ncbi:Exosome component 10 [Geodia barretti]|uniref:Exosome component 10 n=1 Tax=Geodia barretti TaxID=519541 RepID=A0AA35U293_GEOBA|nr:Exosome component 10 [Geodia barretti]